MSTRAAALSALMLGGCVIDAGAELRFAVETDPWTTLEVTVLAGPCDEELVGDDGAVSRLGAIRLLEGTLPATDTVAHFVIDRAGTRDVGANERLPGGTYCVSATARDTGCVATGMALETITIAGQFGDADVVRVVPIPTFEPVLGTGTCGARLCIDDACEAIDVADERCAVSPAPAACELCEAIAMPTSITTSVGGRAICELLADDSNVDVFYAIVDDRSLPATSIAVSYEVATIQVCVTGCLKNSYYTEIATASAACGESVPCVEEVFRRAGRACGGCCAGLRDAGPCGTALTTYAGCAAPTAAVAALAALSVRGSCDDLWRAFLTTYECGPESGCEHCRVALDETYAAIGASPSLTPPVDITAAVIAAVGCLK